jgi:hypothetical protein
MAGAQPDPSNNNWYKRTENIEISLSGALSATTKSDVTAIPIKA